MNTVKRQAVLNITCIEENLFNKTLILLYKSIKLKKIKNCIFF